MVSATSPRSKGGREQYLATIRAVLQVAKQAQIPYVLFVGGASGLEIEPGTRQRNKERKWRAWRHDKSVLLSTFCHGIIEQGR